MNRSRTAAAVVTTLTFSGLVAVAGPAMAKEGQGSGGSDVRASAKCTTGIIQLKAKHDGSRIEVEAEVDTNRVGQTWALRLTDNGVVVFQGLRTTVAPSGSFQVQRFIANRAGTDTITARATRGTSTCTVRVALP